MARFWQNILVLLPVTLLFGALIGPVSVLSFPAQPASLSSRSDQLPTDVMTATLYLPIIVKSFIDIPPTEPPTITHFSASKSVINEGESVELAWSIEGEVDEVRIEPDVGEVTRLNRITVTPEANTTYTLTASNQVGTDVAQVSITVNELPSMELLVFDWNKPVRINHRGFPHQQPPMENGDWTTPTNFADGTFYFRAEIFSQPVAQTDMKLQFCIWQADIDENGQNYNFANEQCGKLVNVPGTAGTVVTWSTEENKMWVRSTTDNEGNVTKWPIDWDRPRYRNGVAVKNGAGDPVSDFNGWNWNGEDPNEWYPLNMRFTVVIVAEGETFSGWNNYIP